MLLPLFPYPFSEYLQWIATGYDSLDHTSSLKVILKLTNNPNGYPSNWAQEKEGTSFQEYVSSAVDFCPLTGLPDELGFSMEEHLRPQHQYHLLMHAYRYAFEYYEMMKQLIAYFQYTQQISVLSIGCSAMLDGWGLSEAVSRALPTCPIRYVGVDSVDFHHKLPYRPTKTGHSLTFLQRGILEDAKGNERIYQEHFPEGAHVISFPHSISTFLKGSDKKGQKERKKLGAYFMSQVGGKQFIAVCATLSQGEQEAEDMLFLENFVDGMLSQKEKHKYKIHKHFLRSTPRGRENIRTVVDINGLGGPILSHPSPEKTVDLSELHQLCLSKSLCAEEKKSCCAEILNKPAEITQEFVNYKIFILEKMEEKKKTRI